jgi:hypothetical protein
MNTLAYRRTAGILVAALVAMMITFSVVPASATHVEPILIPGNPTCGSLGFENEFKVDEEMVESGDFGDGDLLVSILVYSTSDGQEFDWSANFALSVVVAKGGPDANLYEYDPAVASDTGLHAPFNANSGQWYGLSHLSFCYDDSDVTTTTTTEPEETTTTTVPEETTTTTVPEEATTTTVPEEATTTTVPEDTTTTTEPEVEAETTTTTEPEVEAETTTTTEPEVLAETTTTDSPDETLPFTGVDSDRLGLMSVLAVAAGTALVLVTRRSRETRGRHLRG